MINNEMRLYNYMLYAQSDEYGQATISNEIKGQIKMAIYTMSQAIADNIKYKEATYIGLTQSEIDDRFIILYGNEKLKVLYVNEQGRMKQVFMRNT